MRIKESLQMIGPKIYLPDKCPKRYGSIPNICNDQCETEQDLDVRNKGTQHVRNMD